MNAKSTESGTRRRRNRDSNTGEETKRRTERGAGHNCRAGGGKQLKICVSLKKPAQHVHHRYM